MCAIWKQSKHFVNSYRADKWQWPCPRFQGHKGHTKVWPREDVCAVWKQSKHFVNSYRADKVVGRTDGRTDGRTYWPERHCEFLALWGPLAGFFNAMREPLYFCPTMLWTLSPHLSWTKDLTIHEHIPLFFVGYFVQQVYASKMRNLRPLYFCHIMLWTFLHHWSRTKDLTSWTKKPTKNRLSKKPTKNRWISLCGFLFQTNVLQRGHVWGHLVCYTISWTRHLNVCTPLLINLARWILLVAHMKNTMV